MRNKNNLISAVKQRISILALGFIVLLSGCSATQQWFNAKPEPIVIALVGDSITFDGGDNNEFAWVHRLRTELGSEVIVRNYAVNGATALKQSNKPYWQQPEFRAALDSKPDAVFIMFGTNDSKTNHWEYGQLHYQADYLDLIGQFSGLPNRPKVWLGLNPPAFSSAWDIQGPVIKDDILPVVTRNAKLTDSDIIDLHTPFIDQPALFPDGIHPNYEGGNVIVAKLSAAIKAHINQ